MNKLKDLFELGDKIYIEVSGREYDNKFWQQALNEGFRAHEGIKPLPKNPLEDRIYLITSADYRVFDLDVMGWYSIFYEKNKRCNKPDTVVVDYKAFADNQLKYIIKYGIVQKPIMEMQNAKELRMITVSDLITLNSMK